ncbi:MAG: AbrB/MazE/SpoVT family DNA-binding domain-containing protein [Cetobacterium somerae]
MKIELKLIQIGSSTGVVIPKVILDTLKKKTGDKIVLEVENG